MAHRIELGSLGIGGIALAVAALGAAYMFGPNTLSRGIANDVPLAVVGSTFSSYVQCDTEAKIKPSFLKAFVGIHDGQRVLVKGYSRDDATSALKTAFPSCSVTSLKRESKPMWRKLI